MSANENKIHIFHLFCTFNILNYLCYVALKNYTQQYQNQALIRPKQDLSTNSTDIPRMKGKHEKIFLSETARPRALIFGM